MAIKKKYVNRVNGANELLSKPPSPDYKVERFPSFDRHPSYAAGTLKPVMLVAISRFSPFWRGISVYATEDQWQECLDLAAKHFPERDQEQVAAGYAWAL